MRWFSAFDRGKRASIISTNPTRGESGHKPVEAEAGRTEHETDP
jgi:hypothetical protein